MSIYETTSDWLNRQRKAATAAAWLSERDPDGIAGPSMVECDCCGERKNEDAGEISLLGDAWICDDCRTEEQEKK